MTNVSAGEEGEEKESGRERERRGPATAKGGPSDCGENFVAAILKIAQRLGEGRKTAIWRHHRMLDNDILKETG